jgi:hypothetical protein
MILPTKHIPVDQTLLGVGAVLLPYLTEARTVSSLWETTRENAAVGTFDRFILALDLLHVLGLVELRRDGMLARTAS